MKTEGREVSHKVVVIDRFHCSFMVCTVLVLNVTIFLHWYYQCLISSGWLSPSNGHSLFCSRPLPGMFLPMGLPLNYWMEHVTFRLLYVQFVFSTKMYYMVGFATDCPCSVWCRCLLYMYIIAFCTCILFHFLETKNINSYYNTHLNILPKYHI